MPDFTPINVLRCVAQEFKDVSDDTVNSWVELTEPLVSKRRFGKLWSQALALLTAHRMKMAGVGLSVEGDALADINSIAMGGLIRVSNYSEGGTSVGFNTNVSQYTDVNGELALTPYGIQYLSLLRKRIVAITSAGEYIGRA